MAHMKCVSCGIGFFSPNGSDKCFKCAGNESQQTQQTQQTQESHDSCGCGHSH